MPGRTHSSPRRVSWLCRPDHSLASRYGRRSGKQRRSSSWHMHPAGARAGEGGEGYGLPGAVLKFTVRRLDRLRCAGCPEWAACRLCCPAARQGVCWRCSAAMPGGASGPWWNHAADGSPGACRLVTIRTRRRLHRSSWRNRSPICGGAGLTPYHILPRTSRRYGPPRNTCRKQGATYAGRRPAAQREQRGRGPR